MNERTALGRRAIRTGAALLVAGAVAAIWLLPPHAEVGTPDATVGGWRIRLYSVAAPVDAIYELVQDQTPNRELSTADATIPTAALADLGGALHVEAEALLRVEAAGQHGFELRAPGPAALQIGERTVLAKAGGSPTARGSAYLAAGDHPLRLRTAVDAAPSAALRLLWRKPGRAELVTIPADALRRFVGATPVVSPGIKRLRRDVCAFRAGDGLPLDGVHPGWTVEDIRPEGFEPAVGAMAFLPDGRLGVATFAPKNDTEMRGADGVLWALRVDEGGGDEAVLARVAEGLHDPMGLCVVGERVFVAEAEAITELRDDDGDGSYEGRRRLAGGWTSDNYHQFTCGLRHRNGKLYTALSTALYLAPLRERLGMPPGRFDQGPNPPLRGSVLEIDLLTGAVQPIAGGLRTPNGIGWSAGGALLVADNQGNWVPTSKVVHIRAGHFYGFEADTRTQTATYPDGGAPTPFQDRPCTPPAVWLPHNEVCNSPGDMVPIRDPFYEDQLLLAELTLGGIRRLQLEEVDGVLQGAVFRFSQGLEAGVHRLCWGPDGALYAGMVGERGNWSWRGTRFGLQRLVPNGHRVFEMHSIHARADGFALRWTKPIDRAWLGDPRNFAIRTWTYERAPTYGAPKHDEHVLVATRATPDADGRGVRLRVPGLRAGRVVAFRADPVSSDGERAWSTEAWYTLQRLPRAAATVARVDPGRHDADVAAGRVPADAIVLFDGDDLDQWHTRGAPARWSIADGAMHPDGTGPIETRQQFVDYQLHLEWRVPPGAEEHGQARGNSGVLLHGRYEVQILDSFDNPTYADGGAAAVYGQHPPAVNACRAPGEWQTYDLVFTAPRFDDGAVAQPARLTALHNGVLVHDDVALLGTTGHRRAPAYEEHALAGPIRLQDHGAPVQFRNVWVRSLPPP